MPNTNSGRQRSSTAGVVAMFDDPWIVTAAVTATRLSAPIVMVATRLRADTTTTRNGKIK
ncbi:MAG TPA: hypothetical protein VID77_08460 [Stellaceae bacterium]